MLVEIKCLSPECDFETTWEWKTEPDCNPNIIENLKTIRGNNPMSDHHDRTKITIPEWAGHYSGHSKFLVVEKRTGQKIGALASENYVYTAQLNKP